MNEKSPREQLASLFRDAREKAGKSQDEFGDELGVSGAYVSRLENGKAIPSITLVALLGQKFVVDTTEGLDALRRVKQDRIEEQIDAVKP